MMHLVLHARALPLAILMFAASSGAGCGTVPVMGEVGPLVGHVDTNSARIWMQGDAGAAYEVTARSAGGAAETVQFAARDDAYDTASATIDGLQPGTSYTYAVHRPDAGDEIPRTGSFRTAPLPGTPTKLRVISASCIKTRPGRQQAWPRVLREDADLMLLLGDNAYANSKDPARVVDAHKRVRSIPGFAEVVRHTPTYAMWDDHDYAKDGAGSEVENRAELLEAFRAVWPNPGAGAPGAPGAFFRFRHGDVEFFVVDGRYGRIRPGRRGDTRMLDPGQWAWLEQGLRTSNATFKVIASGTTLAEPAIDTWRNYPDRQRLRDVIDQHGVEGVIYLSGDAHYCAIRTHEPTSDTGYPLIEVISSGIANSSAQGFAVLEFDTTIDDPEITIQIVAGRRADGKRLVVRRSEMEPRTSMR